MSDSSDKRGFWQRLFASLEDPRVSLPMLPTVKQPEIGELTKIVIEGALTLAADHGHARATDWHLLAALLATDPVQRALGILDCAALVEQIAFEQVAALQVPHLRAGQSPALVISSLNRALVHAMSQQVPTVTVLHLLAAVATSPSVGEVLYAVGVNTTALALWPRYKEHWPRSDEDLDEDEVVELVMHNDDVTTMEFVETVLADGLGLSDRDAHHVMMTVHKEGEASLGHMSADEARLRAEAIMDAARRDGFPLVVTYRRPRAAS